MSAQSLAHLVKSAPGPKVAIFYQESPLAALVEIAPAFPKTALAKYAGLFRNDILNHDTRSVSIRSGDLNSHLAVLSWILKCTYPGKLKYFEYLPTPNFAAYAKILEAAEQLQVSALTANLKDRLNLACAKQIHTKEIRVVYDTFPKGHKARQTAVSSIVTALSKNKAKAILFILDTCDKIPEFEEDLRNIIVGKRVLSEQEELYWNYQVRKEELMENRRGQTGVQNGENLAAGRTVLKTVSETLKTTLKANFTSNDTLTAEALAAKKEIERKITIHRNGWVWTESNTDRNRKQEPEHNEMEKSPVEESEGKGGDEVAKGKKLNINKKKNGANKRKRGMKRR